MTELILKDGHVFGLDDHERMSIGIAGGRVVAMAPSLAPGAAIVLDLAGRLLAPGLVETHIHLDKACIMERCRIEAGSVAEAVAETAAAKRGFTAADIYTRAERTLRKCLLNGTMVIRTHVEVDPGIGLLGFEVVSQLARDYAWAADIEICVFPQEGLLNNPGTEALLEECLRRGAPVLGAVPYMDSDPRGQIDRIFALARDYDVDIDMHLDLADTPEGMQIEYVCEQTQKYRYGGRVAVGHVTQLSTAPPAQFAAIAARLADSGVAVTVLPATDLYLTGRTHQHSVLRGVTPAHKLLQAGANCSLSTNNVLNPFTPYGDASLIRMANLYANVCHVARPAELVECFAMLTTRSARLLRRNAYGVAVGAAADLTVFDCPDARTAVTEVVDPLFGLKGGRLTFTRPPAQLAAAHAGMDVASLAGLLAGAHQPLLRPG